MYMYKPLGLFSKSFIRGLSDYWTCPHNSHPQHTLPPYPSHAHPHTQCVTFVDKYAPEIVTLLLDGAATKAICTLLHLCLFEQQPLVKNPKAGTHPLKFTGRDHIPPHF